MIELRRARPGEEQAVAGLWNRVFGDDQAFLDDFYRLCVPFDRVLVLAENGVVQSILSTPEITLRFPDGESVKCGYIYAVATDPAARKQGFGRELMRYGEACLREQGADCAILVPAEPPLFRFYDNLGYVPAFPRQRQEFSRAEAPSITAGDRLAPVGAAEYNEIRRRWLNGRCRVDYGDKLVEFQKLLARSCGGDIYRLELPGGPGCAAVEPGEGVTVVKELLCAPEDVDRGVALLCARHPAERYVLRLPPWSEQPGQRALWGMIRRLCDRPAPWRLTEENGYLGLAFD